MNKGAGPLQEEAFPLLCAREGAWAQLRHHQGSGSGILTVGARHVFQRDSELGHKLGSYFHGVSTAIIQMFYPKNIPTAADRNWFHGKMSTPFLKEKL